jgi:nitric oxide synthase oxygenase domain/subunit
LVAKKKYKRLTNKEKQMNKELMAKWRAEGLVPPIKPKLNRKKFAKEVIEEWQDHGDVFYLSKAFSWIVPSGETKQKISLEQIGALRF